MSAMCERAGVPERMIYDSDEDGLRVFRCAVWPRVVSWV